MRSSVNTSTHRYDGGHLHWTGKQRDRLSIWEVHYQREGACWRTVYRRLMTCNINEKDEDNQIENTPNPATFEYYVRTATYDKLEVLD